jgi:excisionase family DNA binding protein
MEERIAYSVTEVAHLLSVSRSWLYRLWQEGKGPPRVRVGGRTLILAAALQDWLNSNALAEVGHGSKP